MEYPYTRIKKELINDVYHSLIKLGYKNHYTDINFLERAIKLNNYKFVDVVIDDCKNFGYFSIYLPTQRNTNIPRFYVKSYYKFLSLAAYYKHLDEF